MKNNFSIFISLLLIAFCFACSEESEPISNTPMLEVTTMSLNFEEKGDSREIDVKCNVDWRCKIEEEEASKWCHIEQLENTLTITVDKNEEKGIRRATLCFETSTLTDTVRIAQLGWGKAILLSSETATIPVVGGTVDVEVTTNIEYNYQLEEGCDWIRNASGLRSDSHPLVSSVFHFEVDANSSSPNREATLTFKDIDSNSELEPAVFTIKQDGMGDYVAVDPEEIKDDIKIQVKGGTASSEQPGEGIERSFDGEKSTIYHSPWDNTTEGYFPIYIEYLFEPGTDMDYLVYYPRTDGGTNGNLKEVDIEVKTNANTRGSDEWEFVMSYNFNGSTSARRVDFPQSLIGVSAIRLTVKSGTGNFASCAEMEFYKKNPENFDYSLLFTDPSCSELKPNITEQEILACDHSFFKNIAYYMYHDKYDKAFRIADYKAYPHPDLQAAENKTSPYSLLDNPTGISVKQGETLVVMVGDLYGQSISLRIQNLDKPDGDGFGGSEYPLATGVNKLTMEEKGLAYIMYHTSDYETSAPVKVHFATGTVNGYFDSQNPEHEGRWHELLENAGDKYFDVVGKYAHLTFPTSRFRNHTTNLLDLINAYDEMVYHEQLLLGLEKYGRMFKNRMYFNVIYTSYMYATSYHTAYNDNTLPDICDETKLMTSACWGPAHEVGHCNQTRPGMKWLGTTEVTNNIMSEYIQTTVWEQPSRLQTENLNNSVSPNYYSKAWNDIVAGKMAHAEEEDVFCKLVPFWQLELYFGKVKGMTPLQQADKGGFYPDVYEYVRTQPDLETPGEQQLEFVYNASLAAKANLIDFFEKWGFLTPVDKELDDYGQGQITITQSQIDDMKRRVESLEYPRPDVALEYITDNNYEIFKKKAAIVPGSAVRSGDKLTLKNWENVIVYEVRENGAEGTLVCASDGVLAPSQTASFTIKGGWKNTYNVYAVSWDNKRIEVIFE